MLIALGVEIELRFALRSTVAEITAIEVSALAAILDFSEHLKMAKMAIRAIAYSPRGRNRASFRSTIDGFRDNGNRSFDSGGHVGFFKTSQNGQNGILSNFLYCPWGRNRAPFCSTIDGFRDNGNRNLDPGGHLGFFKSSQNGQNCNWGN